MLKLAKAVELFFEGLFALGVYSAPVLLCIQLYGYFTAPKVPPAVAQLRWEQCTVVNGERLGCSPFKLDYASFDECEQRRGYFNSVDYPTIKQWAGDFSNGTAMTTEAKCWSIK